MKQFAVGDKVKLVDESGYTVYFGPFNYSGDEGWYLIEDKDGACYLSYHRNLHLDSQFKIGQKVRNVAFGLGEILAGPYRNKDNVVWYAVGFPDTQISLFEDRLISVAEDKPFIYKDSEDYYWLFEEVDGQVRGTCAEEKEDLDPSHIQTDNATLQYVEKNFGPLTLVGD